MTSRFISNVAGMLLGAFLVAASLSFASGPLAWEGLAAACVLVVTVLVAFLMRGRGVAQRALDVALIAVGAWTIVASRSFDGALLKWLMFTSGVVIVALSFAALVVHEAMLEISVRRATVAREVAAAEASRPEPRSIGVAR
jgi:hypothetical protein